MKEDKGGSITKGANESRLLILRAGALQTLSEEGYKRQHASSDANDKQGTLTVSLLNGFGSEVICSHVYN